MNITTTTTAGAAAPEAPAAQEVRLHTRSLAELAEVARRMGEGLVSQLPTVLVAEGLSAADFGGDNAAVWADVGRHAGPGLSKMSLRLTEPVDALLRGGAASSAPLVALVRALPALEHLTIAGDGRAEPLADDAAGDGCEPTAEALRALAGALPAGLRGLALGLRGSSAACASADAIVPALAGTAAPLYSLRLDGVGVDTWTPRAAAALGSGALATLRTLRLDLAGVPANVASGPDAAAQSPLDVLVGALREHPAVDDLVLSFDGEAVTGTDLESAIARLAGGPTARRLRNLDVFPHHESLSAATAGVVAQAPCVEGTSLMLSRSRQVPAEHPPTQREKSGDEVLVTPADLLRGPNAARLRRLSLVVRERDLDMAALVLGAGACSGLTLLVLKIVMDGQDPAPPSPAATSEARNLAHLREIVAALPALQELRLGVAPGGGMGMDLPTVDVSSSHGAVMAAAGADLRSLRVTAILHAQEVVHALLGASTHLARLESLDLASVYAPAGAEDVRALSRALREEAMPALRELELHLLLLGDGGEGGYAASVEGALRALLPLPPALRELRLMVAYYECGEATRGALEAGRLLVCLAAERQGCRCTVELEPM